MRNFSNPAKFFIVVVVASGLAVLGYAGMHREPVLLARFAAFLAITVFAAQLKVRLPGINSSMSVNLPFLIIALTQLSLLETLTIGCASALVQCFAKGRKADPTKALFNICNMANSLGAAFFIYTLLSRDSALGTKALLLACATAAYFFINTAPVAIIIALTERKNAAKLWSDVFLWTYPYYLLSAGLASMASAMSSIVGWQTLLPLLPLVYGVYCSYRKYFSSSQQEKPRDISSLRAAAAHN